ncbi:MAG: DUF115 domain-containing protein [Treponema sp.]|nr:DUF115 domain-containing protein [Treponema sp.]
MQIDSGDFFERNLLALSHKDPELCARLSATRANPARHSCYTFLESRTGELIPAWLNPAAETNGTAPSAAHGAAHPLHSMVDPRKEAQRLIDSTAGAGFLVLLGLGGGYCAEAALDSGAGIVLVVEYGASSLAELLRRQDYTRLFRDPRFILLADVSDAALERRIAEVYQPVLYGAIAVVPLRSRTRFHADDFSRAANAVNASIHRVSADYSVQAHFGKRWFSNIIRNIATLERAAQAPQPLLPSVRRAAVCAAGPSLSAHIEQVRKNRSDLFLIATDTSLPCLLHSGIRPDAVISIDCQHISYHHFVDELPRGVFIFLDVASPPLLASRYCTNNPTYFFSSAHPLSRYVSSAYCRMPELDTSGGNVTYAAVSLAEQLGAHQIELYGADFAYPAGVAYARGTYLYRLFAQWQNRVRPLEAQTSRFLFRAPVEKKTRPGSDAWYYETQTLEFYRKALEEKSRTLHAELIPLQGSGAPITVHREQPKPRPAQIQRAEFLPAVKTVMTSGEFLTLYRDQIAALKVPDKTPPEYITSLQGSERAVFATLLPLASAMAATVAAINASNNERALQLQTRFQELFIQAKDHCLREIDALLNRL